ncbi:MAG: cyclic nucleotide-binding domain-containing protein [Planctomycetota bacterium]
MSNLLSDLLELDLELDLREGRGDELLSPALLAEVAVFEEFKIGKLEKMKRSVVLRRYDKDEIICRQADPGWTAFYILADEDLAALRQRQIERTRELAERFPEQARLDAAQRFQLAEELVRTANEHRDRAKLLKASADYGDPELKLSEKKLQRLRKSADLLARDEINVGRLSSPEKRELAAQAIKDADEAAQKALLLVDAVDKGRVAEVEKELKEIDEKLDVAARLKMVRQIAATVFLELADRNVASRGANAKRGWIAKLFGTGPKGGKKARGRVPKVIMIDGPVGLDYNDPVAGLFAGELFGEMSCMNHTPRSATVRAERTVYMLEMVRHVFEDLRKQQTFKDQFDETYRNRALETQLRECELFEDLGDFAIRQLVNEAELISVAPGEVLFSQGDTGDAMYLVRVGQIKVQVREGGLERVVAYRGRGEVVGEMALLTKEPGQRNASCVAFGHPDVPRGSKYRPGHVELVKISRELVDRLKEVEEELPARLWQIASRRLQQEQELGARSLHISGPVDELGLLQGQRLMLIDLDRCTRCDECVNACASTHDDGRSRLIREGPRFGNYLVPSSCRQCHDPVCLIGCPVGSIHKGAGGAIVIEDWCIGCSVCADQCPYGSINMHPREQGAKESASAGADKPLAVVCDQCNSLKDGVPSCVYACPHDAAGRVDARSFFANPDQRFGSLRKITYDTVLRPGRR